MNSIRYSWAVAMSLVLAFVMLACDQWTENEDVGYESLDGHCITEGGDAYCLDRHGSAAPFCQLPKCGGPGSRGCVVALPDEECRSECGHIINYSHDKVYVWDAVECRDPEAEKPPAAVIVVALYSLLLVVATFVLGLLYYSKWFQRLITNPGYRERMKQGAQAQSGRVPPIVIPPPNRGADTPVEPR